jgi:hypothetical protein
VPGEHAARAQHVVHRGVIRLLQSRPYQELLVMARAHSSLIRLSSAWYPHNVLLRIAKGSTSTQATCLREWVQTCGSERR